MQIQASHPHLDRGLDAYFTPPEATWSLLALERLQIPSSIWEPAAGNGAISDLLRQEGFTVYATDIADYGNKTVHSGLNYLKTPPNPLMRAVITNPPFKLAQAFLQKALFDQSTYIALLLRTNFLESIERLQLFRTNPPSRVLISSRRLPMMHRFNWTGPIAPSNTCHAWFVWDFNSLDKRLLNWFDWEDYVKEKKPESTAEELGF